MNYISLYIILLAHFGITNVNVAQDLKDPGTTLLENMLSQEFRVFNRVDKIDPRFLKFMKKKMNVELSFVNPEEPFNSTDMVIEGLPNKRLIISGTGVSQTDFILLENGGNALYNSCFIYKERKKGYYDILVLRFNPDINSLEKLRNAIRSKEFTVLD